MFDLTVINVIINISNRKGWIFEMKKITNNEEEIWKSLPGVAGVEVSTFGKVRTLDRVVSSEKRTQFIKGRVLKQSYNNCGYLQVDIPIDGKWVLKLAHRLVAQTFLPNPDNLPQVNHLDCDRRNNNVENLEFCTASYNHQYREKFGISNTESQGNSLFAINLDTLEVLHFRSQGEAGRAIGVNSKNINMVIKGKRNYAGGFWFVNDDGHALDVVKSKLHDIGGIGLKIKQGR